MTALVRRSARLAVAALCVCAPSWALAQSAPQDVVQGQVAGDPERIDAVNIEVVGGDAAALVGRLERLFDVGAFAAPWRDGLRTMADLPAVSFDAVDEKTLRVRAPAGDLVMVSSMVRAVDRARCDGGVVRAFEFTSQERARATSEAMKRVSEHGLLPGKARAWVEAPSTRAIVIVAAKAEAHPILERMARDLGGRLVELGGGAVATATIEGDVSVAGDRPALKEEAKADAVAPAPIETTAAKPEAIGTVAEVAVIEVEPESSLPGDVVAEVASAGAEVRVEPAPTVESPEVVLANVTIDVAPATAVEMAIPEVTMPSAPEQSTIAIEAEVPSQQGSHEEALNAQGERVVRVVVLEAADAEVVGARVSDLAEIAWRDVQVMIAGAGNALLVAGAPDEVGACVDVLLDIDDAAARLTEDAMLVTMDGGGADDIASAVQRVMRRPGGELGVRVASDEARGAIALTGPRDAASMVGGLAEALSRVERPVPAPVAEAHGEPERESVEQALADSDVEPGAAAPDGRDVVVRAIRPEGELRETAEFVRMLLERAGIAPVHVTEWLPGVKANHEPLARRRLLLPKRIRLIIKYSQTTLARVFGRGLGEDGAEAIDQVFATHERSLPLHVAQAPRLEVIVMPDRQALALVGDASAVAKGAELASALADAAGLDRIEAVQLKLANAFVVARMIEELLVKDVGPGGQLRIACDVRLNMVIAAGPAGAARRAADLARSMDRPSSATHTGHEPIDTRDVERAQEVLAPSLQAAPTAPVARPPEFMSEPRAAAEAGPASVFVSVRVVVPKGRADSTWTAREGVAVASREFGALVDGLEARGDLAVIARDELRDIAPGRAASLTLANVMQSIEFEADVIERGGVRVRLIGLALGEAKIEVLGGEFVVLSGVARDGPSGVMVDLSRRARGDEQVGSVVLRFGTTSTVGDGAFHPIPELPMR